MKSFNGKKTKASLVKGVLIALASLLVLSCKPSTGNQSNAFDSGSELNNSYDGRSELVVTPEFSTALGLAMPEANNYVFSYGVHVEEDIQVTNSNGSYMTTASKDIDPAQVEVAYGKSKLEAFSITNVSYRINEHGLGFIDFEVTSDFVRFDKNDEMDLEFKLNDDTVKTSVSITVLNKGGVADSLNDAKILATKADKYVELDELKSIYHLYLDLAYIDQRISFDEMGNSHQRYLDAIAAIDDEVQCGTYLMSIKACFEYLSTESSLSNMSLMEHDNLVTDLAHKLSGYSTKALIGLNDFVDGHGSGLVPYFPTGLAPDYAWTLRSESIFDGVRSMGFSGSDGWELDEKYLFIESI